MRCIELIVVMAFALIGQVFAEGGQSRNISGREFGDIPNSDSAVGIAVSLLCSDRSPQYQIAALVGTKASVESVSDSTAMQWSGTDLKMRVWKVALRAAKASLKTYSLVSDSTEPRDFLLYLDSASGVLYRVISFAPGSETKPFGASAISVQKEVVEFPDHRPTTSLFDVLPKCIGNSQKAYLIDAAFLMKEVGGLGLERKMRAVWDIQLHGVGAPPTTSRSAQAQKNEIPYCRSVIDADTGEFLFGSN